LSIPGMELMHRSDTRVCYLLMVVNAPNCMGIRGTIAVFEMSTEDHMFMFKSIFSVWT
jgi:hypothetical protein